MSKDMKTALITGSTQGLGKVMARRLAEEGCLVVINCAGDRQSAEAAAGEINAAGHKAVVYLCDVSDEEAVQKMFQDLEDQYGGVDILVNNARVEPLSRKPELSEGQWWDKVMSVNLKGAFLCSLEFCKYAEPRKWGRIINLSSSRAPRPAEPSMVAYTVSKLGMHSLTRSFAARCAPYNITVNTLAPGMIATENMMKRIGQDGYDAECASIPLNRAGTCDEIADGVIWALKNSFMTGETININGGQTYAP